MTTNKFNIGESYDYSYDHSKDKKIGSFTVTARYGKHITAKLDGYSGSDTYTYLFSEDGTPLGVNDGTTDLSGSGWKLRALPVYTVKRIFSDGTVDQYFCNVQDNYYFWVSVTGAIIKSEDGTVTTASGMDDIREKLRLKYA